MSWLAVFLGLVMARVECEANRALMPGFMERYCTLHGHAEELGRMTHDARAKCRKRTLACEWPDPRRLVIVCCVYMYACSHASDMNSRGEGLTKDVGSSWATPDGSAPLRERDGAELALVAELGQSADVASLVRPAPILIVVKRVAIEAQTASVVQHEACPGFVSMSA
jgi:hypothetical protein